MGNMKSDTFSVKLLLLTILALDFFACKLSKFDTKSDLNRFYSTFN